jgi:LPXTG-motif cell wall-anchored protein
LAESCWDWGIVVIPYHDNAHEWAYILIGILLIVAGGVYAYRRRK